MVFLWDSLICPYHLLEVSSAYTVFLWDSLICPYPLLEVSIYSFHGTQLHLVIMELDMTFTHAGSAQHALHCVAPHVLTPMQFAPTSGDVQAEIRAQVEEFRRQREEEELFLQQQSELRKRQEEEQRRQESAREIVKFRSRVSENLSCSGAG